MGDSPALLTVAETATLLRVSSKTVRRMSSRGELVTCRLGRNVRVDALSVTRLLGLPVEFVESAPMAEKSQRTALVRFDEIENEWIGEIDHRTVRFKTTSREEAELRLAALEQAVPSPGAATLAPSAAEGNGPKQWAVYQEGTGFVIKYRDKSGRRKTHRISRTTRTPVKTMLDAQRYAAVWYREHVLLTGTAARPEPAPGEYPSMVARRLGVNGQTTFATLLNLWVSGEIHRAAPNACRLKETADDDLLRANKYIVPVIGHVPLSEFAGRAGRNHLQQVAAYVDEISPDRVGTLRHVLQIVRRVLGLAVAPLMVLDAQPIQKGDIPPARDTKAKSYLYPDEEAKLLGCTKVTVVRRMLFGLLAREGLRTEEAVSLSWSDVDLDRGVVSLDTNKTDDPRAWPLDPSVVRALTTWKTKFAVLDGSDLIFRHPVSLRPLKPGSYANSLRRALRRAGVDRPQLFQHNKHRQQLRAHDLRATFVTIALASGRTEAWVTRRTGHTSSAMVRKYERVAANYAELNLGPLVPLDTAIPEFRK